ncbi:MAG: alpha-amylase [Nitrospirae bacterium]|nr:MAG: alpha-amylase [Nitrospirota bacterium]
MIAAHLRTPIIYNLFPKIVGPVDRWPVHAERAAGMSFNWLYINPIHEPGMSGSLYAIKHYDRVNPEFLPEGTRQQELTLLVPVVQAIEACGLHVMIDLVVNHTAIDSPLVTEHPEWFRRDEAGQILHPYAIDPDDPHKKEVWGDLAEVDNEASPDREGLWEFWGRLVDTYLDLGFTGFRCDAAYKVPVALWQMLIARARRRNPEALFWAENLGCTIEQTRALRAAGFQFFCNSSKWWNFSDRWCLDQHREFEDVPSVSFPETHDTERLAAESGGSEAVQRQRYAFAATFSAGLMIPIGYEYGFRRRLHVVHTRPSDWESASFDLTAFITSVNRLKLSMPLLQDEGRLDLHDHAHPIMILKRQSSLAPNEQGGILVNRQARESQSLTRSALPAELRGGSQYRLSLLDRYPEPNEMPVEVVLEPAEVDVIVAG